MSLWRNRDFLKLWAGQTISEVGSRITREGLPLTAVLVLNASTEQMGTLSAIGSASVLLFSLGAGVIVDRLRRRPVMIVADLGRAILLATIPWAALTHHLSMAHLLAVTAAAGILTVTFDVAYQSYLPTLIGREDLFEGNRKLSMSGATAEMLGPALTGVLIQLISAPIAVLLDAASFLVSAVSVWAIRKPETWAAAKAGRDALPAGSVQGVEDIAESSGMVANASESEDAGIPEGAATGIEGLREEIFEGMRAIWRNPLLRLLMLRSVTTFLSMGLIFPLYLLAAIRVLHLNTAALGISIALGGAGALFGASVAGRVTARLGVKPSFFGAAVLVGCSQLLIPLAAQFPRYGLVLLCIQQFFGDGAFMIYYVNETTLRQRVTADHLLGRVNAAMQLASRGMLPIGALVGGYLATPERLGIANTLWIGAGGVLLSGLWLIGLVGAEPKA